MSHLPGHRYEPAGTERNTYCGYPDPGEPATGICAREPDHPIHANNPDVEALAAALAARQWHTDPDHPSFGRTSEHRRHTYNHRCALCVRDVHQITAAVLEIQASWGGGA